VSHSLADLDMCDQYGLPPRNLPERDDAKAELVLALTLVLAHVRPWRPAVSPHLERAFVLAEAALALAEAEGGR